MTSAIETRRFENPDQLLDMKEGGRIAILKTAGGNVGMHAIFEPGWTWAVHEKPLLGSPDSCPMHHTGYCIRGKLVVRMVDTDVSTQIGPGDFFEIPPGHDAYVDGEEQVELVLFSAAEHEH
jgi:mannose-6-phosphate isomerase-like protein (cupin superfamily)